MKKKQLLHIASLLLVALLTGYACKKVINVNLNNVAPQIVIEGEITDQPAVLQVKITKTVNFSASNTYPPVTGAVVQITDSNTGGVIAFTETSPGLYTTADQIYGASGRTYQLSVHTSDGQQYNGSSTMPPLVPLDSVTFQQNVDFNNKQDINAVVNFQDPPGLGNYYQFTEYLNGKMVPNTFVFEDRLSDGKYIEDPLFNDSTYLQRGDTLDLTMYCIDKNIYNYFFQFVQVTGNNSFQSATPANPNSNLSNGALGYFSAHTIQKARLLVY